MPQTGRDCEASDSSDEALSSVGWDLRRAPGPPQLLPAPSRILLRASGFPGQMFARWGRVKNFRFYEIQVAVPEDTAVSPDWDLIPIRACRCGSELLLTETVGKLMYFRVRTIDSKGPSPWSDAVVGIVL